MFEGIPPSSSSSAEMVHTFLAGAGAGATVFFFLSDNGTAAPASQTGLHAVASQAPSAVRVWHE